MSIRPPFDVTFPRTKGGWQLLILKVRHGISRNRHNRAEHTNKWPNRYRIAGKFEWRIMAFPLVSLFAWENRLISSLHIHESIIYVYSKLVID